MKRQKIQRVMRKLKKMNVSNNLGNKRKIACVSVSIKKNLIVANFHFAVEISLSCFIHDYDQYLYRF